MLRKISKSKGLKSKLKNQFLLAHTHTHNENSKTILPGLDKILIKNSKNIINELFRFFVLSVEHIIVDG